MLHYLPKIILQFTFSFFIHSSSFIHSFFISFILFHFSFQQVVVTPDVSFDGGDGGAGDAEDEDNIEEDGAGYEEEGEVYPYGTYESEGGDTMVDPSSMAVAGTSGVDGSKGKRHRSE